MLYPQGTRLLRGDYRSFANENVMSVDVSILSITNSSQERVRIEVCNYKEGKLLGG